MPALILPKAHAVLPKPVARTKERNASQRTTVKEEDGSKPMVVAVAPAIRAAVLQFVDATKKQAIVSFQSFARRLMEKYLAKMAARVILFAACLFEGSMYWSYNVYMGLYPMVFFQVRMCQ